MWRNRESVDIRNERQFEKEERDEHKRKKTEKKNNRREDKKVRKNLKNEIPVDKTREDNTEELNKMSHLIPLIKQKKIICFDLYWTLIQRPNSFKIIKEIFKIFWVEPFETLHKIVQTTEKKDIESKCKETGLKINRPVMKLFKRHTRNETWGTLIYWDTLEVLRKLKENWYKLGLISNISEDFEKPLRKHIPNDIFDHEAISYKQDIWVMKPEEKIFKKVLEYANEDTQTDSPSEYKMEDMIMIWDSLKDDVNWAKKVWMGAILLDRKAKKMYYDKERDLIVIHTLYDLLDILWIDY